VVWNEINSLCPSPVPPPLVVMGYSSGDGVVTLVVMVLSRTCEEQGHQASRHQPGDHPQWPATMHVPPCLALSISSCCLSNHYFNFFMLSFKLKFQTTSPTLALFLPVCLLLRLSACVSVLSGDAALTSLCALNRPNTLAVLRELVHRLLSHEPKVCWCACVWGGGALKRLLDLCTGVCMSLCTCVRKGRHRRWTLNGGQ